MSLRPRAVSVKHLPDVLDGRREREFYRELEASMNVERPAIVLDCSGARAMDRAAIHLLVCCLEGAMKRNGDVRLAGVSAEGRASLERAGAARLFHIFETTEEAVASFQRRLAHLTMHAPQSAAMASEHAA